MGMILLYLGTFALFFVIGGIAGDQLLTNIPYIFIYAGIVVALFAIIFLKFVTSLLRSS